MTVVRYNTETAEFELVDLRTGAVLEDGYADLTMAREVAYTYNTDEG